MVQRIDIEEKMRSAYLSYAMSVITARALPDVRDGLKPVQRRILYAMHDMGLRHAQPTRKSARIVGEVLGKYHPHGDTAVYDAMVRMAQDFTMRYLLVDGQGNFGSIDGDGAAALRYTEARLSRIGEEMLADLDKNTVDLSDNFDGSLQEPSVLPARLPNLLVNGVGGIAVGMATNIPPHNLGEVADAIAYLVDHYHRLDDVSLDDLMRFVQGPDFPTGGTVLGTEGIRQAYATGKGRVIMRAQAHTEELSGGRMAVIVSELPYQVNKSTLVERIASLVRENRIEGIADLRDESDRTGMRIVIELKRGVEETPVLTALLKYTQMQNTFGVNMLALVDGEPRTLSLKRALVHYIDHRVQVIERRTQYDLDRALARAHILEGLLQALDQLDAVIDTIRRSRTAETALRNLMSRFAFTELQAQAILDMQLRRLAALEQRKLEDELKEIVARVAYLRDLLAHRDKLLGLVKEDALALKAAYGDARRTRIIADIGAGALNAVDLQPDEEAVVLLTANGAVRRLAAQSYASRAGDILAALAARGKALQALYQANSREMAIFVSDRGQAYGLPVHQLPDATQQDQGLPLANLVRIGEGERVVASLHVGGLTQDAFLTMATRQGRVKRVSLSEMSSLGRTGTSVIGLSDDDALGWALVTPGDAEIVLVSAAGKVIRFSEDEIRPQGLAASGMRGIALQNDDCLVGMDRIQPGADLLVLTRLGFGKRTALTEYGPQGRGGQGGSTVDPAKSADSGPLVAAIVAPPQGRVALATAHGAMHVVDLGAVPRLARGAWGRVVTRTRRGALIALDEGDQMAGIVSLPLAAATASAPEPTAADAKPGSRRRTAKPVAAAKPAAKSEPAAEMAKASETPSPQPPSRRRRNSAAAGPTEPSKPAPEPKRPKPTPGTEQPLSQPPSRGRRSNAAEQPAEPPGAAPEARPATPAPSRPGARRQAPAAEPKPEPPAAESDGEQGAASHAQRTRRTAVRRPPQRGRPKE
jgi:DNA gyrase subunit A